MKLYRLEVKDEDLIEYTKMVKWLNNEVGEACYGFQWMSHEMWIISFFYEEDKVKFILKWL